MIKAPIPHPLAATEAPTKPHLGVVMDEMGALLALPPGANIVIIEDPKNPNKIFHMVLTKVTYKALSFRCACGQRDCTRQMQYQLKASGFHPSTDKNRR